MQEPNLNSDNYNLDHFRKELLKDYVKVFRPMIADLVNKFNKGAFKKLSEEDIDDILQESVIVLYEKSNDPTFSLNAKPSTFIYSVAKNKIHERQKANSKIDISRIEENIELEDKDIYDSSIDEKRLLRKKILAACIKLLSETQKKIFILYNYHNASMKEIAKQFNSNENSMKTQKFKAAIKVKECVKSK
jgi:RNA polymerase sigma factor (sigma-70 family)